MTVAARSRFVQLALSKLGSTVLWGAQGPREFDCSGLVMWALEGVGVHLKDHNAQMLADETPNLATAPGATPLAGDLCFYGSDWGHVTHVAIWLLGGVLSADGATSRVTSLATARANPRARVRLHASPQYRDDFLGVHRNRFVDDLDLVTR